MTEDYGVLDNKIRFPLQLSNNFAIKLNDVICYLAIKEETSTKFVKILSVLDSWDPSANDIDTTLETRFEENFNIVNRVILGKVKGRDGRFVLVDANNLKINLDEVKSNFIPVPGDWVEVYCRVQQNSDVSFGNDIGEVSLNIILKYPRQRRLYYFIFKVLEVLRICSVRSKVVNGKISFWNEKEGWGVVDNNVIFTSSVCDIKHSLKVGDSVSRMQKLL